LKKFVIFGTILVVIMLLIIPSIHAISNHMEIDKPLKEKGGLIRDLWWNFVLEIYNIRLERAEYWYEIADVIFYHGDYPLFNKPFFAFFLLSVH